MTMQLSLGPLQYYWPRQTVFDFYEAMATTAADFPVVRRQMTVFR